MGPPDVGWVGRDCSDLGGGWGTEVAERTGFTNGGTGTRGRTEKAGYPRNRVQSTGCPTGALVSVSADCGASESTRPLARCWPPQAARSPGEARKQAVARTPRDGLFPGLAG